MIETARFHLRPLTASDVSERYLAWLSEGRTLRFINGATGHNQLEELKAYVSQREGRDDVLFLGIFTRAGEHIGNIKYEPIDVRLGAAVVGILIGETAWRGHGVAGEVMSATAFWLRDTRKVHVIALGVDRENLPGIRAYEKLGFVEENHPLVSVNTDMVCPMVWRLPLEAV
jgi:RimJ/RimL family protein N-acetyltransferase